VLQEQNTEKIHPITQTQTTVLSNVSIFNVLSAELTDVFTSISECYIRVHWESGW